MSELRDIVLRYLKGNRLTQKQLADKTGLSIPTISRVLKNERVSLSTKIRIENVIETETNPPELYSDTIKGGYSKRTAKDLVGSYDVVRPLFSAGNQFELYGLTIDWCDESSCLSFKEHRWGSSWAYTHQGVVYMPPLTPCFHLLTIETGSVRLLMLSSIQVSKNVFSGVLCTLRQIKSQAVRPAACQIILRKNSGQQKREKSMIVGLDNTAIQDIVKFFDRSKICIDAPE